MHDCGWSAAFLNFSTQQYHYNYTYVCTFLARTEAANKMFETHKLLYNQLHSSNQTYTT